MTFQPSRKRFFGSLGLVVAAISLMSACSGEPTTAPVAPAAPVAHLAAPSAPSASLLGTVGGLLNDLKLVGGVQRIVPLTNPITVTQTIGAAGGTISIPSAGAVVVVPAGAVSGPTVFKMTARAGSLVAYDFEPHGTVFAKPLAFTQDLHGTNATLLSAPFIQLGYYSDPSLLTAVGGLVSELTNGTLNLLTWKFSAPIKHFSGYMMSCGRVGADAE